MKETWIPAVKTHMERVELEGEDAFFELRSKKTGKVSTFFVSSVTVATSYSVALPDETRTTEVRFDYCRTLAEYATPFRANSTLSELLSPDVAEWYEFEMPAWLESIIERALPRL